MTAGLDGLPLIGSVTEATVGNARLIFMNGQVADRSDLEISEQLGSVLNLIEQLLRESGARRLHILSVRINLSRAEDYAAAMSAWEAWATAGQVPARAVVCVKMPGGGRLVDLDVIAAFSLGRFA